jgi:hypothetical protein
MQELSAGLANMAPSHKELGDLYRPVIGDGYVTVGKTHNVDI